MLGNYKIRVNNEAESTEAQELFEQLGFEKTGFSCDEFPYYLATWEGGFSDYPLDSLNVSRARKEITLPQLRDIVVLHRNDVKDATHKYIDGCAAYKTADDISYLWTRMGWEYKGVANDLVPLHKEGEQGLITGAEALRALADGHEVQHFNKKMATLGNLVMDEEWGCCDELTISDFNSDVWAFRLKPNTVKIEIEIPAPFEPKDGDEVYFIDCDTKRGYSSDIIGQGCDPDWIQFGAWKSEDEIKQVVAALRSTLTTK